MNRIPDLKTMQGYCLAFERSYSDFMSVCEECKDVDSEHYMFCCYQRCRANYRLLTYLQSEIDDIVPEYGVALAKRLQAFRNMFFNVEQHFFAFRKMCENDLHSMFSDDLPF